MSECGALHSWDEIHSKRTLATLAFSHIPFCIKKISDSASVDKPRQNVLRLASMIEHNEILAANYFSAYVMRLRKKLTTPQVFLLYRCVCDIDISSKQLHMTSAFLGFTL